MTPETLSLVLQYVISPAVVAIVMWLAWLTITVMNNVTKIGINSALDEQTQTTLAEIKSEMKELTASVLKVLAAIDVK